MTFKEAAQQKRQFSDYEWENYIDTYCPYMVGLEGKSPCEEMNRDCKKCWEREMPNTEAKEDGIPVIPQNEIDAYNKGFEDGMSEGLTQGQNDAWEFVNKLWDMNEPTRRELFGEIFVCDIIKYITPQEALAKLKAYEEAQSKIEVGDVVEIDGEKAVVSSFGTDNVYVHVMYFDGIVNSYRKDIKTIKKTGKHLDISSILEQIGE